MDDQRFADAVKRGAEMATAVAAILHGLSLLRQPVPAGKAVLPVALAFGLGYLFLVYFQVGPIGPRQRGTD